MKTNIRGVGVALVTPFTDEDGVDFAALDKLIERVIGGGADYLVALGTTAETPALSGSEKEAILRFVVERSAGRVPVIAGLGGNSTADVVSALRSANLDGVDAVLSVTPYYNKPSQEGIYRHYKALAEASPKRPSSASWAIRQNLPVNAFAATEIMPSPPSAAIGTVKLSSPEITANPSGRSFKMYAACDRLPLASLTPMMFPQSCASRSTVWAVMFTPVRPGTL